MTIRELILDITEKAKDLDKDVWVYDTRAGSEYPVSGFSISSHGVVTLDIKTDAE